MIRNYMITLQGLTPLLMHWDNIEWSDQMEEWKNNPANKKLSKAGDDRTPPFRWIGSVYHDGKNVCIPADCLAPCLMQGGAMVPVPGGKSGKTFKSQTQSGMRIGEMFAPLMISGKTIPWAPIQSLIKEDKSFVKHLTTVRSLGFDLFVKRARIGASKHIRVRPKFEDWSLTFTVQVWDDQIDQRVLEDIVTYAGSYKGLCDWRPGSKTPGPYGTFKLVEIEEIAQAA